MDDQRTDFKRLISLNQRLALGYVLVAIGALGLLATFQFTELLGIGGFIVWIVSGALICGGIFHLFNRLTLGVLIGLAIQIGILLLLTMQPHIIG